MQFTAVKDNGGDTIQRYILYADDGLLTTTIFTPVASYLGQLMTFTLDNTIETSFLTGSIYRFYLTAQNSLGESIPSNTVRIALDYLPA
jgi:hypothetical protein